MRGWARRRIERGRAVAAMLSPAPASNPVLRRVAVAQTLPVAGDVAANVQDHLRWMEQAAGQGAQWLQFPELSLTGYEPTLLHACALPLDSPVLNALSQAAQRLRLNTVVGLPLVCADSAGAKPWIGAVLLHADGRRTVYHKHHLLAGEDAFAQPGYAPACVVALGGTVVGLAICADANHPIHAQRAAEQGARLYSAGILTTATGVQADSAQLCRHAVRYGWHVLMANFGGATGPYVAVGQSAIWGPQGQCLAQAPGDGPALVVADMGGDAPGSSPLPVAALP